MLDLLYFTTLFCSRTNVITSLFKNHKLNIILTNNHHHHHHNNNNNNNNKYLSR